VSRQDNFHHPTMPPNLFCNDPSAGSPTETLLRLLLPLNDQV
jgi:hypothetical protein